MVFFAPPWYVDYYDLFLRRSTQLARLMARDQINEDEARKILSHETEQHVSELEPQAHLFFSPEDSLEDFLDQLNAFIKQQ